MVALKSPLLRLKGREHTRPLCVQDNGTLSGALARLSPLTVQRSHDTLGLEETFMNTVFALFPLYLEN